jgi:hypothetical protein
MMLFVVAMYVGLVRFGGRISIKIEFQEIETSSILLNEGQHTTNLPPPHQEQKASSPRPLRTTTDVTTTTTTKTTTVTQQQQQQHYNNNNPPNATTFTAPDRDRQQQQPPLGPFRFLFAIMSMDSPSERVRRSVIRSTYLAHYDQWTLEENVPNRNSTRNSGGGSGDDVLLHNTNTKKKYQICTLKEFQHRWSTLHHDKVQCPFVYAFVLGGYPSSNNDNDAEDPQYWKDNVTFSFAEKMVLPEPGYPFSDPEE